MGCGRDVDGASPGVLESPRTVAERNPHGLRGGGIIKQELRINEEIRAREVRVISPDGQQLGVLPVREALRLAHERHLDLVEIAPHADPPVCRIMDYGKYKYEQSKKEREARKRQKIVDIKEIRMSPKIEDHDFDVKARSAARFLSDGDKVKITVRFRGREIVHADLAKEMLEQLVAKLGPLCTVERPPRVEGRAMIMVLAPRTGGGQTAQGGNAQRPAPTAAPSAGPSQGAAARAGASVKVAAAEG